MNSEDWDKPLCQNCFARGHTKDECPTERSDLYVVHKLAAFIGARLQYMLPRCNSGFRGGKPVSTIKVDQHKEKFFWVRVYCDLADPELVQKKWESEDNESYPTPEYVEKCFRSDALHYRACYLDMIEIIPRLKDRIRGHADYPLLLLDDEAEIDREVERLAEKPNMLKHYCEKYRAEGETAEALKQRLKYLCKVPSLKEWSSDA